MDHQDWTTIIINKVDKDKKLPKNIVKKTDLPKPIINSSVKLDENDEVINIKYVSKDISQQVIMGRIAKKLTRKDLANKLNLKEDIIADIETGKAIYNGNTIAKIKKCLT